MKLQVTAVGRGADGAIQALTRDYLERLNRFTPTMLVEVAEERRPPGQAGSFARALRQEAGRIEEKIPRGAMTVPLDIRGHTLSSQELAQRVEQWMVQGEREVCFVIGGPDGLDPEIIRHYPWSLSLGAMTFPHMLTRVLLLEQLYRAFTILKGIPYHR